MFLEYNTWTGTFGLGLEPRCEEAQGIRRLAQSRSFVLESFGTMAENETDLKRKSGTHGLRAFEVGYLRFEGLVRCHVQEGSLVLVVRQLESSVSSKVLISKKPVEPAFPNCVGFRAI